MGVQFKASGKWNIDDRPLTNPDEPISAGMRIAGDSSNTAGNTGLIENYLDHNYEFSSNASFVVTEEYFKPSSSAEAEKNFAFKLTRGKVHVKNPNLGDPKAGTYFGWPFIVRVKTEGAATGTKGTDYTVERNDPYSKITVYEGLVDVIQLDSLGRWVGMSTVSPLDPPLTLTDVTIEAFTDTW